MVLGFLETGSDLDLSLARAMTIEASKGFSEVAERA
jgi:hypothetical protein